MTVLPPRPPRHSLTEMTELVLPPHANALGTVFGGQVMAWVDICAAIAAHRHCGRVAVTAAVDEVVFLAPIHVGEIVRLEGRVNAVFGTSLEVEVLAQVENPATMDRTPCVAALLTFVAVGEEGKPVKAPVLLCESEDERRRSAEAHKRRQDRLARRRLKNG